MLVAFWLSIHCQRMKVINHVLTYDLYLRQLVTLALAGRPQPHPNYQPSDDMHGEGMGRLWRQMEQCGVTGENAYLANLARKPPQRMEPKLFVETPAHEAAEEASLVDFGAP